MNIHIHQDGTGVVGQPVQRVFERFERNRRPVRVALNKGRVHAVDAGRRRRDVIRCLEGRLWLTLEGDLQDHLVRAGEVFIAPRAGRVLVSALADSRLEVASTRDGRC